MPNTTPITRNLITEEKVFSYHQVSHHHGNEVFVSHAVEAGSPAECHSSYYVEGANEKSNAELEAVIFALDEYTPEGENTATEALEF